jgi:hypothetical protein
VAEDGHMLVVVECVAGQALGRLGLADRLVDADGRPGAGEVIAWVSSSCCC